MFVITYSQASLPFLRVFSSCLQLKMHKYRDMEHSI
jgi:hypothetical protein